MIDKIIVDAKKAQKIDNDHPVATVQANILESLLPAVKIKDAFFQPTSADGQNGWKLYIVTHDNEAIVLPIYPACPINLLNKDGLRDDLKEFKVTASEQVAFVQANSQVKTEKYNSILKGISDGVD